MDVKLPSEPRVTALPDCTSDHEEQEVSDDDDDDRNHKHRRREARSHSMERDQPEQYMSRPYGKRGKPFGNGSVTKESDPQSHYNFEREFPPKFEKRRPFAPNSSRFPSDANQRFKLNQSFSGDLAAGRGRGRDSGPWSQRDSRFTAIDIASQMASHGPIPPAVFAGRGLHSVSNPQSAPWAGGFGLIPGITNGAIDPIHPLGLQGPLRSPLNPSLNMGIPRQRCRDFEERGFCLRGDMCPMEHGVNRIVVEDVQSLSQFNLPVSLPSAHLLGNPAGSGLLAPVNASPSPLIGSKGLSNRASKSNVDDDGYASVGAFSSVVDGNGADVYDPDQPLWNSDCPQSSTGLALQTPTICETESFMEVDPSDRLAQSSGAAVGLQSTSSSVWGRMNSSKNRLESRGIDSRVSSSDFSESRTKGKGEYASFQGTSYHGKRNNVGELVASSSKMQNDIGRPVKKPAHKALRTLFVSCIPLKDNKKETLLSHFKKFGEVIDIYIPSNTERAFVQFSKREEAEKALKSPDAVMGNRFIKLLWANRDSIADDGFVGGSNMPGLTHRMPEASFAPHPSIAIASKENNQLTAPKGSAPFVSDSPRAVNGPKGSTAPPAPKKSENLELLREELRKKQEMLEQKRNEFRQQLNKLQKHATGTTGDLPEVQASKKLKVEGADGSPKSGTPKQLNLQASSADSPAEGSLQKTPSLESVSHSSKIKFPAPVLDLPNYKHAARSFAQVGSPFPANRYKLDNRPTSFKVNAPLPTELANVSSLRDHFALFGDVSNVELEHSDEFLEEQDDNSSDTGRNSSARVCFKTRQGAERAFINGKSWNGHNLHLTWVIPSKPSSSQKEKSLSGGEHPSLQKPASGNPRDGSGESAAKETSGTEIQSLEKPSCVVSQDSCGGSQNSAPGPTSFSGAEAQSADKSAVGSSGPGGTDSELVGKEADENTKLRDDPVGDEAQHAEEEVS